MDATRSANQKPPVILLVYANDRVDPSQHLRNLPDEIHRIRDALKAAEQAGLCQVLHEANATADRIFSVFQDPRYGNRIAIFHYAGHANGYQLLLESADGARKAAHAAGLATFLREQRGLELVFLNGCSTDPQVEALLNEAGCAAAITTSQAIDDEVAMTFAEQFYRGLAGGQGLESAFNAATGSIRTDRGDNPRALYWGGAAASAPVADHWPWELRIKSGAEQVRRWNLPDAAGNPLFGLPALPPLDLPESPFQNLSSFHREHAAVFFGRGFQIRELYNWVTAADAAPILLYYGESGVGKSSVLAAGLLPRLEADYKVHHLPRKQALGLLGTLMEPLGPATDALGAAWRRAEEAAGRPLLLVLDQVEEVFTHSTGGHTQELATLIEGLRDLFGQPGARPRGRLILSFRKEWLPEINARLKEQQLPHARLFLEVLDRPGVIEAVSGPACNERLRQHYGLKIERTLAEKIPGLPEKISGLPEKIPWLPEEIADDLLADPKSPVAPTLQILLTKLWNRAREQDFTHPKFTHDLYLELKREGILLGDFLDQKLHAIEQWRPQVVQSGLALDLLAFHTTAMGAAEQRTEQELLETYVEVQDTLPDLVQHCKDDYLLADIPTTEEKPIKGSRLVHDTLAPLVRERFEKSDRPGQRARRVLENRGVDWQGGKTGAVLDESDLETVETGIKGMRRWDEDERRLIDASRQARENREQERKNREKAQRRFWWFVRAGVLLIVVVIAVAGVISFWQMIEAQRQERLAIARLQASEAARAIADGHPQRALLLAAEAVMRPLEHEDTRLGRFETQLRERFGLIGGVPIGGVETQLRELLGSVGGIPKYSGGPVRSLTFDPSGRWLATGGDDGAVRLWDFQNLAAEPRKLPGDDEIITLAFDFSGRWLAAGGKDGTVRLWDFQNLAAEPRKLPGDDEIITLAFGPQGRWLAVMVEDKTARLWDLKDPAAEPRVLRGHEGRIATLAFDPQGRWLATGSEDKTARLWDLKDPAAEPRVLRGHEGKINTLAFDPQGHWLATGSEDGTVPWGKDGTVRLWDFQNPAAEPWVLRGHEGRIATLAFDPQGQWLATGGDDATARLWDLKDPAAEPRVLRGHESRIATLAFDPQGRWLAAGGKDGTVRLWDFQNPAAEPRVLRGDEGVQEFRGKGGIAILAFHPQSRWLATGGLDATARLWDLKDPAAEPWVLRGHKSEISILAFDPQGRWLATGSWDATARLWDLMDLAAEPRVLRWHEGGLTTLAFDPQGRWLATGSWGGTVRLWDLMDLAAEPRVLHWHEGKIETLAFNPQGRWLATGSWDNTARLWDLKDLAAEPQVLRRYENEIATLAFDPQGRWLATGGKDGTVRLWDFQNPAAEPRVLRGHKDRIATLAFDPQGRWLATGSEDKTARLWDLKDPAAEPWVLRGHEGKIETLAFNPQGRWLATGSWDNTARLWDLKDPAAEPRVLRGHEGKINTLAFDPQGHWLATGSWDNTARLWQLDIQVLLDKACQTAGRNLTLEEWRQHFGEIPYQVTCPQFPSGETLAEHKP